MSSVSPRVPGTEGIASSRLWLATVGLLAAFAWNDLWAAEIYVSVGTDGSSRYATQPLDATYRLLDNEAAPSQLPSAISRSESLPRHAAQISAIIERAANRHGLPSAVVEAVASVESNLNPAAVSRKGAQGAMQLMPATAAHYGLRGPKDWHDPERNVEAGVRHLKALIQQHQGNVTLALAAYNAGRGSVSRYRERIPPYRETMIYVAAVLARAGVASSESK